MGLLKKEGEKCAGKFSVHKKEKGMVRKFNDSYSFAKVFRIWSRFRKFRVCKKLRGVSDTAESQLFFVMTSGSFKRNIKKTKKTHGGLGEHTGERN